MLMSLHPLELLIFLSVVRCVLPAYAQTVYYHYYLVELARIFLNLSRHLFRSCIAIGRSSNRHQAELIYEDALGGRHWCGHDEVYRVRLSQ